MKDPAAECTQEEAGATRTTDTGRGLAESPEDDLDRAPSLPRLQKTLPHLPITPRKKCDRHVPPRGPGPGLRQDPAPVHALAPDLGPDASQGAARSSPFPFFCFICQKNLFVLTRM